MSLKLSDVVTITGVAGLHKVVKADTKNVILEALDATRKRSLARANMLVSKLSDISMYTENEESESLTVILRQIKAKYGESLPVNKKSSNAELLNFLAEVLPNYDREKVYVSNVKKLVQWYEILTVEKVNFDEEAQTSSEESSTKTDTPDNAETVTEAKPKKKAKTETKAEEAPAVAEEEAPKKKSKSKK